MQSTDSLLEQRLAAAQDAFEAYVFGDLVVTDMNGWDSTNKTDLTRIFYFEGADGSTGRGNFHVEFEEGVIPLAVYALDMDTGNLF